jgi:pimeloyl-ACP methyl ester carboxylesterase
VTHAPLVDDWEELGRRVEHAGEMVYVNDQLAEEDAHHPPLLVIHGFPTSSIDFAEVMLALHARRRILMLDLPGYGFSDKVDRAYSLFGQADAVETVIADAGIEEVDLLTHDMGDSVGGELLARDLDGDLSFSVRRRVVSNGSIYMDLAQLTPGQQFLESLGDRSLSDDEAPDLTMLRASLVATMSAEAVSMPSPSQLDAAAELIVRGDGHRILPRLIRYLGERRQHEARWTGAIERHPSPLSVVWGDRDPIAVFAMAERLAERRPDASVTRLDGVGHYPMMESPDAFADAVCRALDGA